MSLEPIDGNYRPLCLLSKGTNMEILELVRTYHSKYYKMFKEEDLFGKERKMI